MPSIEVDKVCAFNIQPPCVLGHVRFVPFVASLGSSLKIDGICVPLQGKWFTIFSKYVNYLCCVNTFFGACWPSHVVVHACRLAGCMIASNCDDGTFRIGDLRSFQVCLPHEHLFLLVLINGWIYVHHWGSVVENGVSCYLERPNNWKIFSYVKKGTCKNLMDSSDKAYVVPPMCLRAVWLFVLTVSV